MRSSNQYNGNSRQAKIVMCSSALSGSRKYTDEPVNQNESELGSDNENMRLIKDITGTTVLALPYTNCGI